MCKVIEGSVWVGSERQALDVALQGQEWGMEERLVLQPTRDQLEAYDVIG